MTTVWQYWTGPMPGWIELCLDSVKRRSTLKVQVLSQEDFMDLWDEKRPQVRDGFPNLSPNMQSDMARAWLMRSKGGIYLDADCLALRNLALVWDRFLAASEPVLSYRTHLNGLQYFSALIASEPDLPAMREFYERCCRKLIRKGPDGMGRLGMGPPLFSRTCREMNTPIHDLGKRKVHPIPIWTLPGRWRGGQKLFDSPGGDDVWRKWVDDDAYLFMLTNRALSERLRRMPAKDILTDDSFAGYVFRRAILDD